MTSQAIGNAQRLHDALHELDINPAELDGRELAFLHALVAHRIGEDLGALLSLLARAHTAARTGL